jgi:small subunit ribosomal protein S3Ae
MAVKKGKLKKWFVIIAPKYFGEKEIGTTLASEESSLIGRRIEVSPVELTNDMSKYYMKLIFKITKVEGEKAFTEFDGSECMRDYISRMVLHKVRRIDVIQDLVTKDGKKIRVKSLAIARKKMTSSIEKVVRKEIEKMMKEIVENSLLEEFVKKILSDEIKNKILKEIKKIYPLRNFEIRKTEML